MVELDKREEALLAPPLLVSFDMEEDGKCGKSSLEHGQNRAVVVALDELPDLIGLEGGHQGLDCLVVLVAFLHRDDVGVGLGGIGLGVLGGQGIGGGVQTGLGGHSWS